MKMDYYWQILYLRLNNMVEVAGERTGQSQNVAVLLLSVPEKVKQTT
jgi:hypothetical protein